jgi:hypothetical protein
MVSAFAGMLADGLFPFILDLSGSWKAVSLLIAVPSIVAALLWAWVGETKTSVHLAAVR